ncbi:MAG TPA: pyridoxamine 5'-phosphate oxidase family protein, partial [Alphaproteobacteria bacterium]|nr:pyridoxamine 5'-phosphate oxidase family protein [Alphaproteobacteria bacterium]
LMFTPTIKSMQAAMGSRGAYERFEEPDAPARDVFGEGERAFIGQRDSFYMATVSETGWPYVQHRGGPKGFLKVLDGRTLGFADYKGNRQYVSVGNLLSDDRVSLFLMDYPNRRRLKVLGHARIVDRRGEPETIERLSDAYDARIERGVVIALEGFDWNCPQHIAPRFTEAEVAELVAPLVARLREAEARGPDRAADAALGVGPLELAVSGIRQLTPRVRGYELRAVDGEDLPAVEAGAHLTVPVRLADGAMALRSYSIASDPARRDAYEIAVLREEEGRGGSAAVHTGFALGTRVNCEMPRNAFRLHDDARPALLIAGGIGITPIKAMAHALIASGRGLRLHYAARSPAEAPFRAELAALLGDRASFHFGADRLDIRAALEAAPDAVAYVCGPERLIDAVRAEAEARGWAAERVRSERFAEASGLVDEKPFEIQLARSGRCLSVGSGETALAALERAGVPVASSCRTGSCGTCRVRAVSGLPDHRDAVLSAAERAAGAFTPCVSRARSPEIALDL